MADPKECGWPTDDDSHQVIEWMRTPPAPDDDSHQVIEWMRTPPVPDDDSHQVIEWMHTPPAPDDDSHQVIEWMHTPPAPDAVLELLSLQTAKLHVPGQWTDMHQHVSMD